MSFKLGDYVKIKNKKFGIVCDTKSSSGIYVSVYDGIKITTDHCSSDQLTLISEEKFYEYIKRSGNSSFHSEIQKIKEQIKRNENLINLKKFDEIRRLIHDSKQISKADFDQIVEIINS